MRGNLEAHHPVSCTLEGHALATPPSAILSAWRGGVDEASVRWLVWVRQAYSGNRVRAEMTLPGHELEEVHGEWVVLPVRALKAERVVRGALQRRVIRVRRCALVSLRCRARAFTGRDRPAR